MANGKAQIPAPPISYYDFYKTNAEDKAVVYPGGPSLTRQEFLEECDINILLKRYEVAGATINGLPRDPNVVPQYADFSEMPTDLLGYMDMMKNAETAFMTLPAIVRREFENDPVQFVEFASDPANLGQMRTWGLAPPAVEPPVPQEVKPAPPDPSPPEASK